jgi:hypothetical protein
MTRSSSVASRPCKPDALDFAMQLARSARWMRSCLLNAESETSGAAPSTTAPTSPGCRISPPGRPSRMPLLTLPGVYPAGSLLTRARVAPLLMGSKPELFNMLAVAIAPNPAIHLKLLVQSVNIAFRKLMNRSPANRSAARQRRGGSFINSHGSILRARARRPKIVTLADTVALSIEPK